MDKKFVVHCLNCARKISDSLNNFVVLEEYDKAKLLEIYDKFVLHVPTISTPITPSTSSITTPIHTSIITTNITNSTTTPTTTAT